jgi:hypothetical protein
MSSCIISYMNLLNKTILLNPLFFSLINTNPKSVKQ